MGIIKKVDEITEQARVRSQPTVHGMSFTRLTALTKDITGIRCDKDQWDITISGESPMKRDRKRP